MKYDIYRCAGALTLELVEYLRASGVRAWVPLLIVRKRLPRSKKRIVENRAAIPGYVFVPRGVFLPTRLPLSYRIAPLWAPDGGLAACTQEDLVSMQEVINDQASAERREALAPLLFAEEDLPKSYDHLVGTLVRITTGPFSGWGGIVKGLNDDGTATVDLKNTLGDLNIPPCLLAPL